MRYYKVVVTDPDTGKVYRTYTSLRTDGSTDPGALNVEIDAPVTSFSDPMSDTGAQVRIWGIPLQDLQASSDFNGKHLQLYGGMAKGLPLANPGQAGLLLEGKVFQAYGNWVGTAMTLDLIVLADTGTSSAPANIVLDWHAGQTLAAAVTNTLNVAFPGYRVAPAEVNPGLVLAYDVTDARQTLSQFARFLKQLSAAVVNGPNGGTYNGVELVLSNGTFYLFDGTSQTKPRAVSFLDLIGQPTWINPFQILVVTVMRADLHVGDYVTLPQGLATTQPQGLTYFKEKPTFQGTFQVDRVRHVGNYRSPDATSWATSFNMHKVPQQAS